MRVGGDGELDSEDEPRKKEGVGGRYFNINSYFSLLANNKLN